MTAFEVLATGASGPAPTRWARVRDRLVLATATIAGGTAAVTAMVLLSGAGR